MYTHPIFTCLDIFTKSMEPRIHTDSQTKCCFHKMNECVCFGYRCLFVDVYEWFRLHTWILNVRLACKERCLKHFCKQVTIKIMTDIYNGIQHLLHHHYDLNFWLILSFCLSPEHWRWCRKAEFRKLFFVVFSLILWYICVHRCQVQEIETKVIKVCGFIPVLGKIQT